MCHHCSCHQMDEAYKSPTRRLSRRSQRIVRLTSRTPPSPITEDIPTCHMPPCSRTTQITPSSSPRANAPSSPDPSPSRSPTRPSHSTIPLHGTRLSAQSSFNPSLKGTGSPRKHQRRKSAPVSSAKSPVETNPQQLKVVPSCAQAGVRFEDLSEGDKIKRVRVLAERSMRVSDGEREGADKCYKIAIDIIPLSLFLPLPTSPRRYSGVLVATKPFASVCERGGGWNRNTPKFFPPPTPENLPQKFTPLGGFVPGSVAGRALVMALLTVAAMMMMILMLQIL